MTDLDASRLVVVLGACLAAVIVLMVGTALLSRRLGRVSVVDVTWGLGFVVVALVSAVLGNGDSIRRWVLLVLVAAWGIRLAWHIGVRSRGKGEDRRYAAMLKDGGFALAVRKVFVVQGVAIWFISLPIQVASVTPDPWGWVAWCGVALWLLGVSFETVGDAQLSRFRADPANKGGVMDAGLWGWTRHPNYFGDSCVWWGVWLIAAETGPGLFTVLSPVAMTYFLVFATGARLLERTMMQRPGYPGYAARTSFFFPLPPRRGQQPA